MLEWIVSSSVLAALMIVLRYLLRGHISLRLQYSIWLILLLRLLLPVSLGTSPVSVANALPQAAEFNYVQTNQSQGDDSRYTLRRRRWTLIHPCQRSSPLTGRDSR